MSLSKVPFPTLFRPDTVKSNEWADDIKEWPEIVYGDVYNYLVNSCAIDGEEMKIFKSLDSYNYLKSGCVGKILHFKCDEDFVLLKSEVRPSQKANEKCHLPWVLCGRNGTIYNGECTCVAGRSKTCSHVGALLWKVEYAVRMNLTGKSCTDEIMKWNSGTSKNIEPGLLNKMDFQKPKRVESEIDTGEDDRMCDEASGVSDFQQFVSHAEYQQYAADCDIGRLLSILNTLINKSVSASPDVIVPMCTPTCHVDHASSGDTCPICVEFYNKYVCLSDIQINTLTQSTTTQAIGSTANLWKDSRKIRLTGSTAHKVPVRNTTNPDNFIREQMYPSFQGNRFTAHGNAGEIKAKSLLRENGMNISDSGTVVSQRNPWLSVSPDGIIHTDSGNVLLEIKCPSLDESYTSLEAYFDSKKYDVVKVDNGYQLKPKGPRGYYLQVQLTLHVCQLAKCAFVVWTPEEYKVISVMYDKVFCDREIARLQSFYFEKFLPRIVDDFESS